MLTLAFGMTSRFLMNEKIATQALATVYFLLSLILRFGMITAVCVEFRSEGAVVLGVAFLLRVWGSAFYSALEKGAREYDGEGVCSFCCTTCVVSGLFLVFAVPQYFLPLGDTLQALIDDDKRFNPTVTDMLTSRFALTNLALTFGEAAIAWLCVLLINSSSHHIPLHYFYYAGVVPVVLMLFLLPLIWLVSKKMGQNLTTEEKRERRERKKRRAIETQPKAEESRTSPLDRNAPTAEVNV